MGNAQAHPQGHIAATKSFSESLQTVSAQFDQSLVVSFLAWSEYFPCLILLTSCRNRCADPYAK
ncbi:hypothetical protein D3C74_399250 [compost metagenome]